MTKKKFVILINPRGGTRRGTAILEEVEPVFVAAGADVDVRHTEHPGHATDLARTLDLSQCDGLCVIGGDGTIHEVVNGLLQRSEPVTTPLGLIPGGTGNSVVLHLGYTTPLEAAQRILAGHTSDDEFLFVVGCNTQFTAKGMRLAPRADLCDGKIDVIVVRASFGQMLRLFHRVFDGSHLTLDCVEYHQVRSFRIDWQTENMLNLDGELKGRAPAAVQMLPGAIHVFS